MKIKKIVLLIPAFLILIPMFLSATGGKTQDPLADMEPLTYLVPDNHVGDDGVLLMYEEWMKATGVKVTLQPLGTGGQEKLNTILASGDLPDMIICTRTMAEGYGQQGAFVKINEYLDQAPNTKKYYSLENNPWAFAPDGNLYFYHGTQPYMEMGWQWRQDWADRLGIPTPKTVDDWAAAWRKVKLDNPDSIPWMTVWSGSPEQFITPAWGIGGNWSSKYTFENGELKFPWVSDKMKEVITFIRDMYAEGLLWEEYLTAGGERRNSQFAAGKVFSTTFYQSTPFNTTCSTQEERDNTVPVAPPIGPYGDSGSDWLGTVSGWGMGITSTCKNIPAAIKWFDYIYGEEGARLYLFGKEGVTFEYDSDGNIQFTDNVKQEAKAAEKPLDGYLRDKYGIFLYSSGVGLAFDPKAQVMRDIAIGHERGYIQGKAMVALNFNQLNPPIWTIEEEGQELTELLANINTYRKEWTSKFIVGQEPMSKWDEYVKKLEELGYKEVERLLNQGYERYLQQVGKSKGYAPEVKFDTSELKDLVGLK